MSSGVLVADWMEGMKFALGPTMVVRRRCLEQIGGFRVLRPYHADDYMLGNLAAAQGWQVLLSTHVVSHHVLNSTFLCSMRHQLRWMKSTRFSRPKGHLGTVVTFGTPYAMLFAAAALALHRPWLGAVSLTLGVAIRCLVAGVVAKYVVDDPAPGQSILLFPLRDFVGLVHWIASYLGRGFQWRGEVYRFHRDGVMRNSDTAEQSRLSTLIS
jgi:ceramide glucosyltransferase